jgi:hypothetical protein
LSNRACLGEDSPRGIMTVPARRSICPSGDSSSDRKIGDRHAGSTHARMRACAAASVRS